MVQMQARSKVIQSGQARKWVWSFKKVWSFQVKVYKKLMNWQKINGIQRNKRAVDSVVLSKGPFWKSN